MRKAIVALIRVYQYLVSPMLGPRCRFYPSCSEYASEAISRFGVCRGTLLSMRRLLRCHPWHPGGVDPCPQHFSHIDRARLPADRS